MPLVRLSPLRERSPAETSAPVDGLDGALRATFAVPEDDCFTLVDRRRPGDVSCGASNLGMACGDDLVIVRIVCDAGRTIAKTTALHAAIAENFGRAGVHGGDVSVSLVDVAKENRSFGRGIAHAARP